MSVETPSSVQEEINIDEEIEEEEEEDGDEEEDVEEEDEAEVTHGRSTGRGLTLKTLLKEGVLQPGEGAMTINYLGNKFKGDLLSDGRIKSQETNKIFGTPSAWAIYCKKIVNPDKKSGCGWASVRYRGKKLDEYKNNWFRQKRLEFEREGEILDEEEMTDSDSDGPHEQEIVEFEVLGNRSSSHDMNTMVELTSFQSMGRMQPFNVTMSSSAMAVIDVHSHVSNSEVVGYLAGQWDVTNHNLIVSHAFPVRCRLGNTEKGSNIEKKLYDEMDKLNLSLVGWYHTHPFSPPLPTLRDIDSQLEYEMKMKGSNDASYTPCVGIIVAPYVRGAVQATTASGFWVLPPPEHKPQEYGRPMSIQYTIVQDAFMPKDALIHIRNTIRFYKNSPDSVIFDDIFQDCQTYWDKLKTAIQACVPKDHFSPLLDYLAKLLEIKNYVPEVINDLPPPKPKTPVSDSKSSPASEVIDIDAPTSSTLTPIAVMESTSEITEDIDKAQKAVLDSERLRELIAKSQEIHVNPQETQQMEVTYSQETELSSRKSPNDPPEAEGKEDFQPITYREESPPPYQPPPYQPQLHSSPYQPSTQEDTAYEGQKQDTPKIDLFQEKYPEKQQDEALQEPSKYTEPPPDYHQKHLTISSSLFETPRTETIMQEKVQERHSPEESVPSVADRDDPNGKSSQYSENIPSDSWPQRFAETLQQSPLQVHPMFRSSSPQLSQLLHRQSPPVHPQKQPLLNLQQQLQTIHQQSQLPPEHHHPQQQIQSEDMKIASVSDQEAGQMNQQPPSQLQEQQKSLHFHQQQSEQTLPLHQLSQLQQQLQQEEQDIRQQVMQPMDVDQIHQS